MTTSKEGEKEREKHELYASWFGNLDTDIPIPVGQINTVRKINEFEGLPGKSLPTSIGTRIIIAIV